MATDNTLTQRDEEMAMLIVTFCDIGDCQTFFYADYDGKPVTRLEFKVPGSSTYLEPHRFLRNKKVQGALKTGLFKMEGKAFEACEMAWKYIEKEGYLR